MLLVFVIKPGEGTVEEPAELEDEISEDE